MEERIIETCGDDLGGGDSKGGRGIWVSTFLLVVMIVLMCGDDLGGGVQL